MFQSLEQLETGSLFILTGQSGAGKSHLAASTRRSGTVWILDTEGAAKNLLGKPGVHKAIQAVQTLSLQQILAAMQEILRIGKAGDTVVLDSVSKVLQAMRAHAQQRAGAETDRKTQIEFDEYASFNRNLQAIYTGLTELKQHGFHVIIIGHLAKQYSEQSEDRNHTDVGLRVLADEHITYEADAIILVERDGEQRQMRPIIKPPRPLHLKLGTNYPAKLGTLYPELALDEAFGNSPERTGRPADANEAERRFFARYSSVVGGNNWNAVQRYLGRKDKKPSTIEGWISAAEQVRQAPNDQAMAA